MKRVLFDPSSLLTKVDNWVWGEAKGVETSIWSWVTSSSTAEDSPATSAIENFGVTGEAQNQYVPVQGDSSRKTGETSAPPPRPEGGPLPAMQPPSGVEFKARLLARARWPESRNVEDRRGLGPQKSDMTIDEWVDKHSEWRKK